MHFLVLQHQEIEHAGSFRAMKRAAGITWDTIHVDQGQALPALDNYDALWVMGGPQDTWQTDEFPWLTPEIAYIRKAVVTHQMPFLGLCLGHQLLAEALGGKVGPGTPEIGVMDVVQSNAPLAAEIFADLPQSFATLQWHGAEVTGAPAEAVILAHSPVCAVQAMAYGRHAISAQFHMETEPGTVRNWAQIPTYAAALDRSLGDGAVDRLDAQAASAMDVFTATAKTFFRNWMRVAAPKEMT